MTSFNPDLGISIDRNVGKVNSYGFDASIAVRPVRPLMLLALASYIHAELKENVEFGERDFRRLTPRLAGLIFCDAPPTAIGRRS